MRRRIPVGSVLAGVVILALAGGRASGAPGAAASDVYITGRVIGRVPGKNLAAVEVAWAYKCLGDKLGDATYDWTLKIVREQPVPRKTTVLGEGTSKIGSMRTRLPPGQYLPIADPYRCETERGAGFERPEIGGRFVVPDYCAWSVTSARGQVQLEQGAAVKAAKAGATVRPGDSVVTPKGGLVSLAAIGREGSAALTGPSRLKVDAKQCAAKGGWRLQLAQGSVTASVKPSADAKRSYQVGTPNATASARPGARWLAQFKPGAKPTTKVKVFAGSVVVAGKSGASVSVKAGKSTSVTGSSPPGKPTI